MTRALPAMPDKRSGEREREWVDSSDANLIHDDAHTRPRDPLNWSRPFEVQVPTILYPTYLPYLTLLYSTVPGLTVGTRLAENRTVSRDVNGMGEKQERQVNPRGSSVDDDEVASKERRRRKKRIISVSTRRS